MKNKTNNINSVLRRAYERYSLISSHADFYYQNAKFVYGRHQHALYISMQFPIVRQERNKLYELFRFPVPLDNDILNTNATSLTTHFDPGIFVINTDSNAFAL